VRRGLELCHRLHLCATASSFATGLHLCAAASNFATECTETATELHTETPDGLAETDLGGVAGE